MWRTRKSRIMLGLGALLFAPLASLGRAAERTPVVTTPHFAFFNDYDTNLNDALNAAGLAHKDGKPELFHSGTEEPCFGKLPQATRAAWDTAVDYYAKIISPADWTEPPQYLVRVQLAGFDDELKDAADRQFVEIVRSFRAAATPAYKACRWAAQDEKNRRWIDELKPRLAADEKKIASRLEQLYQKQWGGLPIPVDVVETVNWSGANSILRDPVGGHLLISNAYAGPSAVEVVFHESSHLLMGRNAPVRQALESAAKAADFRLPGDLWHVVLFYTTGEAVRRILDEGGKPGYTPMLYGIFDRGTWVDYRKTLENDWRPYIDGKRTLSESATSLVEALHKTAQTKPAARSAAADSPRHLIYLHGRIVQEEQSARPRHPQYGYYELDKILDAFRARHFVVSGGIRPKSASVSDSADQVVEQIRRLVRSGVPADHVTVVGGSMGASIALLASARLRNPDVRFCVLGACLSESVRSLVADEGKGPSGRLLSIREASDDSTDPCPPWKDDPQSGPPLVAREMVLHTGLGHGFLYQPLPEWVDPVVDWADDAPSAATRAGQ